MMGDRQVSVPDGILPVNKPAGFTSHDVTAKLRGILHVRRIGHTGTLDPMATGVLPVAIGQGTRLVSMLTEKRKAYEAVLLLGITTDTQDSTGTVLKEAPVECDEETILRTIGSFAGEQMQIPPMYSAIRQNGKRLYELAREGITVEREARPVTFYEIRADRIELPRVYLTVSCSKGTYIRTLCHDIGERLGCGGCMEGLTRIRSGEFALSDCHTLSEIEEAVHNGTLSDMILSPEQVLASFPAMHALEEGRKLLENGNPLPEELLTEPFREGWGRMYTHDGTFVGIYAWNGQKQKYFPVTMFYQRS